MPHVAGLCVFTWCLSFLAESCQGIGARPLLVSGFLGAFGVVVRPQAAVLFLLPALVATLVARRKELARSVGFLALGGAAPLAFLFAYNFALSGHPFRIGYLVRDPSLSFSLTSFAFGFSPSRLFSAHLPWFLHDLNATVWGFPWGDLLPLVFLLVPAPGRRRDAWLAACVLVLVIGFSFFRFYDISHSGPRYAFEALGVLALLVARAFRRRVASRRRCSSASASAGSGRRARPPPWSSSPSSRSRRSCRSRPRPSPTPTTRTPPEPLRRLAAAGVGPSALVLVAGNTVEWTYGSFLLENGPDPRRAPRVFARDLPEKRAELLAAYPREEVWRVEVTLRPLPHPNLWIDNTWDVEGIVWTRLR